MTPAELGRFVREDLPKARAAAARNAPSMQSVGARLLLDAVNTTIGLLQEALDQSDPTTDPWHPEKRDRLLATLRLVLGEGGEGERSTP